MFSPDLKWAIDFFNHRNRNRMRFFYRLPQEAICQQLGDDVNLDHLDDIAEELIAGGAKDDANPEVKVITSLKDGLLYLADMTPENTAKYGDGKILQEYTEKILAVYRERYLQTPSLLEQKIEEARQAMKCRHEKKLQELLSALEQHESEMDAYLQADFWELQQEALKKPLDRKWKMPIVDWLKMPKDQDTYQVDLEDNTEQWSSQILTIEEIRERIRPVCQKYGIKEAYVFGDYAENAANEKSTVDIHIEEGEHSSLSGLFSVGGFRLELVDALQKDVRLMTCAPEKCTLPPIGYFGKEILVYAEG